MGKPPAQARRQCCHADTVPKVAATETPVWPVGPSAMMMPAIMTDRQRPTGLGGIAAVVNRLNVWKLTFGVVGAATGLAALVPQVWGLILPGRERLQGSNRQRPRPGAGRQAADRRREQRRALATHGAGAGVAFQVGEAGSTRRRDDAGNHSPATSRDVIGCWTASQSPG